MCDTRSRGDIAATGIDVSGARCLRYRLRERDRSRRRRSRSYFLRPLAAIENSPLDVSTVPFDRNRSSSNSYQLARTIGRRDEFSVTWLKFREDPRGSERNAGAQRRSNGEICARSRTLFRGGYGFETAREPRARPVVAISFNPFFIYPSVADDRATTGFHDAIPDRGMRPLDLA